MNKANQELLQDLKKLGVPLSNIDQKERIEYMKKNVIEEIEGKSIVLTGVMQSLKRKDAQKLIEHAGGRVNATLNSQTDYLVVGEKAGSKLKKAEKLGIAIINEIDLKKILRL